MAPQYGNRGSNVTVVRWIDEDGTEHIEAWSAAGTSGRRAAHVTADDRRKILESEGVEPHLITVRTVRIQ